MRSSGVAGAAPPTGGGSTAHAGEARPAGGGRWKRQWQWQWQRNNRWPWPWPGAIGHRFLLVRAHRRRDGNKWAGARLLPRGSSSSSSSKPDRNLLEPSPASHRGTKHGSRGSARSTNVPVTKPEGSLGEHGPATPGIRGNMGFLGDAGRVQMGLQGGPEPTPRAVLCRFAGGDSKHFALCVVRSSPEETTRNEHEHKREHKREHKHKHKHKDKQEQEQERANHRAFGLPKRLQRQTATATTRIRTRRSLFLFEIPIAGPHPRGPGRRPFPRSHQGLVLSLVQGKRRPKGVRFDHPAGGELRPGGKRTAGGRLYHPGRVAGLSVGGPAGKMERQQFAGDLVYQV
mmetsp:Transcript_18753/g.39154  ORF Transcript_18753/g.39154 Transcript_18753/m.39154 type:complete len:344 (+) Transcript_18753:773-1804(+)